LPETIKLPPGRELFLGRTVIVIIEPVWKLAGFVRELLGAVLRRIMPCDCAGTGSDNF